MRYSDIPKMLQAQYRISVSLDYMKETLSRYVKNYSLELQPDFQRVHVWNDRQREEYVSYILRGGISGLEIYFNCPGWMHTFKGPMVLVDGLQRITAVTKFLNDEIKVFGCKYSEFEGRAGTSVALYFNINDLSNRREVLKWYLDLNSGVAHAPEELDRVRRLLVEEDNKKYNQIKL